MFSFLTRAARLVSVPLAVATMFAASVQAQDTPRIPERLRGAFPQIVLDIREAAGQDAVNKLGTRLSAVAEWYIYFTKFHQGVTKFHKGFQILHFSLKFS